MCFLWAFTEIYPKKTELSLDELSDIMIFHVSLDCGLTI